MSDYEDLAWRIHELADQCGQSPVGSRFYCDLEKVFTDLGLMLGATSKEIDALLAEMKEQHVS